MKYTKERLHLIKWILKHTKVAGQDYMHQYEVCACCVLRVLRVLRVTCCMLHVLRIACSACCVLRMLHVAHVAFEL